MGPPHPSRLHMAPCFGAWAALACQECAEVLHMQPRNGQRHRIRKDCTPSGPRVLSAADYKLHRNPYRLGPLYSLFTSTPAIKIASPAHLSSTDNPRFHRFHKQNVNIMSLKNGGSAPFDAPSHVFTRDNCNMPCDILRRLPCIKRIAKLTIN